MFCQAICSCSMWSKIRRKVLKTKNYEQQANAPFTDLDDEDSDLEKYDKSQGSPSKRENRRSTNGFTKCLIPHLTSGPIGCACKKSTSPLEASVPIGDKPLDGGKVKGGKESKKWADDKKNATVKSGVNKSDDRSLNYYFKETDSCELVRKSKTTTLPAQTGKFQKNKNGDKTSPLGAQTTQMPNKKVDNHILRPTSMKDKKSFPAGQRDIKSGLDFKDFQRVFENSQESIADQTKTVTFGTFGKDIIPENEGTKKQPPLFHPIRTKKVSEESSEIPIINNQTLLNSSLSSSSKGASLTSEEGAESGYGTQDDGNDRLARSISSNSDCPSDFPEFDKLVCGISRESTGEEDVFQHLSDSQQTEKMNRTKELPKPSSVHCAKPSMTTTGFKPLKVSPNRNIVVAEIHAENFDEPKPRASTTWITQKARGTDKVSPLISLKTDRQNNNQRLSSITTTPKTAFDVNCNPQKNKNNTNTLFSNANRDSREAPRPAPDVTPPPRTTSMLATPEDSDSDEEDIREYLPADVTSMSEVYNRSSAERGNNSAGGSAVNELYASVPKSLDDSIDDLPLPEYPKPLEPIILEPTRITPESKEVKVLPEKLLVRPDVIDCHDVTEPMVTEPPPPSSPTLDPRPPSPEGSEDDTIHLDYDNDSFSEVMSDDGDSGPPLPSRNYSNNSQTLSRDEHFTDLEKQQCEAPTLVMRRKTPDKESSISSSSDSEPNSSKHGSEYPDSEEITSVEEPIHMTWEEVMKEAKTLGIPLSPPTVAHTLDRRLSSASSQDSSSTPIASPVKRTVKVRRAHSEAKKSRSPFKEKFKLQNLFTLRKSKADHKTVESKTTDRIHNRRSMPASAGYDTAGSMATAPREHSRMSKSCMCGTPESAYRVNSPIKYTYYTHHAPHPAPHPAPHHTPHHAPHPAPHHAPHHHHQLNMMNVSINVSVISGQNDGAPASPGPETPMSPDSVRGATLSAASMMSQHSMSNQSLSQQSVFSGHSSYSYQSAHSATSVGSPSINHNRSKPNVGGTPNNSPSYNGANSIANSNYGTNGMVSNSNYGTNGTVSNGYYGTTTGGYSPAGEGNGNADFIGSLLKLKDCGWYWGPLGWDDAESKLANKPDGSFLVRDSSDDRYILSLSFRSQGTTHHTRIEHYKGMFSFYSQPKSHGAATIVEFIEKAMEHSRNGKFLYFLRPRAPGLPPAPVQLLYPVSRLQNMQSLQHMCRFVILKQVRKDHIDRLPIPPRLKEYLKQNQYYTEYLGGEISEAFPML